MELNHIVLILFILYVFYFIWDLKEHFYVNPYFLWAPTRSTRLMSYDIRGDPYLYYVYPPYFSYTNPFSYYLYNGDRYDISGRYLRLRRNRDGKNERNVKNEKRVNNVKNVNQSKK